MPATLCPRCGSSLADRAEGLCPRCLLAENLVLEQVVDQSTVAADQGPWPAPPLEQLRPLFPQLEIVELLGQGGMGAVYKARQVKLDRLVALKILPPQIGRDPAFAERFTREARALARLSHPHIVTVHDFGEVNGMYYLLMEYVDGVNLRQALQTEKLPPARALGLVRDLCETLQFAHDMGVVHRDIKPENVLLDRQGRVKVADFGLAKLLGTLRPERLTGTRQVMGTPHYMAPEQMEQPQTVDHRADIYSLGVVFYELLTGELPLGKFAPPSQKAEVNDRVDEVVLRAMEREPERRFQKMTEMKTAVERVGEAPAEGRGQGKKAVAPLHFLDILWMAAVVAVMVFFFLLAWSRREGIRIETWNKGTWSVFFVVAMILSFDLGPYLVRLACLVGFGTVVCWTGLYLLGQQMPGMFEIAAGIFFCYWFGAKLRETFTEADPNDEAEEKTSVPGLLPGEEKLRQELLAFRSQLNDLLYVIGEIDGETLASARSVCEIPAEERVLGVLDFGAGETEISTGLVFGGQGIYYRNAEETRQPGVGKLSYAELAERTIVNHGKTVYLGKDQYLCPLVEESGIDCEQLALLLVAVRKLCGQVDQ